MSLLDDVSIVVTPNGYKAGELYAVVPVPTEGSEEVTDGNFPTPNTAWSLSPTFTIADNKLHCVSDGSYQYASQSAMVVGKTYRITFDITGWVSGNVRVGPAGQSPLQLAGSNGSYIFYYTAVSNSVLAIERNGTPTDLYIENISVKEYTSADMDVTRETAATRVDEDGLVNYAEVIGDEEVTNGDFSSSSDWNLGTNSIVSSNKATLTITSGGLQYATNIGLDVVNTKTYKITFTANRTSGTGDLEFGYGSGLSVSGSPTISASGTQTIYFQPTYNTNDFGFKSKTTSGDYVWEISNVSVKEVTRDNVPRIDYTGGGCPHILAEPMRTNLVTYSEAFSNWNTSSGVVVTDNTTELISPSGDYNASKIEYNGSNKNLFQAPTLSGVYSGYFYVKGTIGETIRMSVGGVEENFTLTGDWDKIKKENVTAIANTFNINTFGGATATTIYLWGGQVEQGSYATSYIPTSGSTVTRNQDIFTRDGIGSLINSTEGVLFVEMAGFENDAINRFINLNDGTTSNRINLFFSSVQTQVIGRVSSGGVTVANMIYSSITQTSYNKIAVKWKLNDFALWVNGSEVLTDLSGVVPTGLNKLSFDNGGGSSPFYGKVKQLQVYNTALTDAQLEDLTS